MRARTTFTLTLEPGTHHDNAEGTRRARMIVTDNDGTAYTAGILHLSPHDLETLTAILSTTIGPYQPVPTDPPLVRPWS